MRRMMMSWALAHVKGNSGERRLETSAVRPRCGYWSTNRPIRALCLICVQWFEPWMKGWAHGSGVSQPVCLWTSSFQTLWTKRNLSPLKNISSLTSAFVFLHFWVFANFFRLHKDRKCRFRDPVEHTNTKSTGFSMRFWMEDFSFLDLWRTKKPRCELCLLFLSGGSQFIFWPISVGRLSFNCNRKWLGGEEWSRKSRCFWRRKPYKVKLKTSVENNQRASLIGQETHRAFIPQVWRHTLKPDQRHAGLDPNWSHLRTFV